MLGDPVDERPLRPNSSLTGSPKSRRFHGTPNPVARKVQLAIMWTGYQHFACQCKLGAPPERGTVSRRARSLGCRLCTQVDGPRQASRQLGRVILARGPCTLAMSRPTPTRSQTLCDGRSRWEYMVHGSVGHGLPMPTTIITSIDPRKDHRIRPPSCRSMMLPWRALPSYGQVRK